MPDTQVSENENLSVTPNITLNQAPITVAPPNLQLGSTYIREPDIYNPVQVGLAIPTDSLASAFSSTVEDTTKKLIIAGGVIAVAIIIFRRSR